MSLKLLEEVKVPVDFNLPLELNAEQLAADAELLC